MTSAWEESLFTHIHRVDEYLHIGNRTAGHSREIQRAHGIDLVCRLSTNNNEAAGSDLFMCLGDSANDPRPAIAAFLEFVRCNPHKQILVHCDAGSSRSGTMVVAYLMRKHAIPARDALALAQHARACICPNDTFMTALCGFR